MVSKVFEKPINDRIVDHLEKYGLFSDFQCGFRSNFSDPPSGGGGGNQNLYPPLKKGGGGPNYALQKKCSFFVYEYKLFEFIWIITHNSQCITLLKVSMIKSKC